MQRGQRYRVAEIFIDADGDSYAVGEEWTFICGMFSKFDNEIIVCVRLQTGEDWKIPLIWDRQHQQEIIENFERYVVAL